MKSLIIFLNIISLSLNKISHCLRTYEICTQCNDGYYIVRNEWQYTCSNLENCLSPIDNNKCESCVNNYMLDNNNDCIQLYPIINNCRTYDQTDTTKCSECEDGFALSSDYKECKEKENCRQVDSDNNCILCAKYYILNADGTCERSLCEKRDNDNLCIKCADGYFVSEGECGKNPITNCLNYIFEDHTCSECFHFSQLNENKDECHLDKLISGCNFYSPTDDKICLACSPGYQLTSDKKKCQLINCNTIEEMCYQCQDGYFIADNGRSCQKSDPNGPDLPDVSEATSQNNKGNGNNFSSFIGASFFGMIIFILYL